MLRWLVYPAASAGYPHTGSEASAARVTLEQRAESVGVRVPGQQPGRLESERLVHGSTFLCRVQNRPARSQLGGGSERFDGHRPADTPAAPAGFRVDEEDLRVVAEDMTR